ncbi:MAG: DUF4129 domain-containing protein [Roseiflexus sp.]
MSQRMRRYAGWLFVALGALIALAAGLPSVVLEAGKPFPYDLFTLPVPGRVTATDEPVGMGWLSIVLPALGLFIVVMTFVSRGFRRWLVRSLPVYLLIMLTTYLLIANLQPPVFELRGAPAQTIGSAGQELESSDIVVPPDLVTNPPAWLVTLISLALASGLTATAWWMLRRFPRKPVFDNLGSDIAAEAQAALRDLEAGANVRDTVTRCYVEMMRILRAERGILRAPDMTAREFEQRLARTGLAQTYIHRLTRLFEMVRYSPRAPGPREAREAEECLRAIVEAYQSRDGTHR